MTNGLVLWHQVHFGYHHRWSRQAWKEINIVSLVFIFLCCNYVQDTQNLQTFLVTSRPGSFSQNELDIHRGTTTTTTNNNNNNNVTTIMMTFTIKNNNEIFQDGSIKESMRIHIPNKQFYLANDVEFERKKAELFRYYTNYNITNSSGYINNPRNGIQKPTVPPVKLFFDSGTPEKPTNYTKYLLDYVVAGFAKCGTTALGQWLESHPEMSSAPGERYLSVDKLSKAVRLFHRMKRMSSLNQTKVGFRCPHFLQSTQDIGLLQEPYFSNTKLVVSVRHPVIWFESYYNYRLEANETQLLKGTPNELIGTCKDCRAPWILSTAKGVFHHYLAALQKTPMNDTDEMDLLRPFGKVKDDRAVPNKIFLVEMNQLSDTDENRTALFRSNLQEFLGLQEPLLPIRKVRPGKAVVNFTKINICNDEYLPVRNELMRISESASLWFRNYFMKSDDVYVSSPDYVMTLFEKWMLDPCDDLSDS